MKHCALKQVKIHRYFQKQYVVKMPKVGVEYFTQYSCLSNKFFNLLFSSSEFLKCYHENITCINQKNCFLKAEKWINDKKKKKAVTKHLVQ